ncbi:hypothetical protein BDV18DRAFT_138640 [Aspergillus unguis]
MESQDPYPPQAHHTQTPTRSVHIDFTGWQQTPVKVTEGTPSGAVIYTVDLTRRPQMKFLVGTSQTSLATVSVQALGSSLGVAMHGRNITVDIKSRLKTEGNYKSPSLQNASMTWKSRSMKVFDFELRDSNAVLLAQFNPHSSWSRHKAARLDLFGPSVSNGRLMEEIVVTGVALVHSTMLQLEAAAGQGASS